MHLCDLTELKEGIDIYCMEPNKRPGLDLHPKRPICIIPLDQLAPRLCPFERQITANIGPIYIVSVMQNIYIIFKTKKKVFSLSRKLPFVRNLSVPRYHIQWRI